MLVPTLLRAGLCLFAFAASPRTFAAEPNAQTSSPSAGAATTGHAVPDPTDQREEGARWSASIEAIALGRSNSSARETLISRIPGTHSFAETATETGTEALNSSQFRQGVAVGPKLTLAYHGDSQYGWELSYFTVLNLDDSKTVGPENPLNWYVMKAPGSPPFWQTQDFPNQGMTWGTTTDLYGAELSVTLESSRRLRWAAGFGWIRLNDSLVGSLTPADQYEPAWKTSPYPCGFSLTQPTLVDLDNCTDAAGVPVAGYPPFWTTSTTNDLFGLQAGVDGILFESGRLMLNGAIKVGIYDNRATQSAQVSIEKQMYYASATRHGGAFAGEGRVELRYLVAAGLSVKLGYEAIWLDRVALAPGQISRTYSGANPTSETAAGVNASSNVLYHGATLGLAYSF
jgi:hypothetical protein